MASLKEENPLLDDVGSLQDVSDNITINKVWASQIEVGVTRLLLAPYQVSIVVVEADSVSAADQLLAALDKVKHPRTIVLIRVDDCHYRYLQLSSVTRIFNTAWLIYYCTRLVMMEDSDGQLF